MKAAFSPYKPQHSYSDADMLRRAEAFYQSLQARRSIRTFSNRAVSQELLEKCILAAGTAPSGANQQPWHFSVVKSPEIKHRIREAAEHEEAQFYAGRAGSTWLEALEPLGTDASKPFLEIAPALIAIFEQKYALDREGRKIKHYYSKESVGIATGMLITALHQAGLSTLTHTPSPMNFLTEILQRPEGERPFLLLVVGHPSEDAMVPDLKKKSFSRIASLH